MAEIHAQLCCNALEAVSVNDVFSRAI